METKYTLWTKTEGFCPACMMTKQFLDNNGVLYINRSLDNESGEYYADIFRELGYMAAPIITEGVITDEIKVVSTGFHPDVLNDLVKNGGAL